MNLTAVIVLLLKISIALSVFALGLDTSAADTTLLFRRPRDLGRAFLSMNLVMPLVALALVMALDLNPAVKIAVVALSVSPVPPIFPKKALRAGGRHDYAIGLLTGSAVLAILVIPAVMEALEVIGRVPLYMSIL